MQIRSNALLKWVVPLVLLAAMVVALRACYQSDSSGQQASNNPGDNASRELTAEEMEALGIEADTPRDTVATLVGEMAKMRGEVEDTRAESARLREQNKRLAEQKANIQSNINEALSEQQAVDQQQRDSLMDSLNRKFSSLRNTLDMGPGQDDPDDMPVGLGLDGEQPDGAEGGMTWVDPLGAPAPGQDQGQGGSAGGGQSAFATSFAAGQKQVASATDRATAGLAGNDNKAVEAEPVYTVPKNATLVGSVAMSALLGRVPIDGTVQDPYPFKIVIGPENLTANGIELPELKGAIVSGTATGDWTLSCVRGDVTSITFVFQDDTIRVVPESDEPGEGSSNNDDDDDIGYISNPAGVPCVSGARKTNARSFILTSLLLSAGEGAANAISGGETTTSVSGLGATSGVTGNTGTYIAGQAAATGISEVKDWIEKRFGQTFDAVYVPPGQQVVVNIDKTLPIDYETRGRRVHHVRYQNAQRLD